MQDKYDLILVGTGFASSFFLSRYLERFGDKKKILVLEGSSFYGHASRMEDIRSGRSSEFLNFEGKSARAVENSNLAKPWVFNLSFGGGSNCWSGCTPRFMPNDFKLRSTYNVGRDWPLSYNDLEEYYTLAEDMMHICGPADVPFPKSKPYKLGPHALTTFDKLVKKEYPLHYISQPSARPTAKIGDRPPCCSSGVCSLCPIDSKFTIENSMRAIYFHPSVTVKYNSKVFSLIKNGATAQGVMYDNGGKEEEVYGEAIVLGANAIFNAHILLNSGDTNSFTGRGLDEQAGVFAFFYLDGVNNVGGSSMISANGYMMYDVASRSQYSGCLIESINTRFVRSEHGKWRHIAKLKFIFENLPSDDNRVTLSSNKLVPKIEYKGHSEYANNALKNLESNVNKVFGKLPIEEVFIDTFFQKTEYHICGTTRMSEKAESGVVDPNSIHHTFRNVFVLGSGAFPTMSPANPSLTISALALRAVDKAFGV